MISGVDRRLPLSRTFFFFMLCFWGSWYTTQDSPVHSTSNLSHESQTLWQALITQAGAMGLPTEFIRTIKAGFVTVEFDDLHAFAAEYHPEDHLMVLNRSLSFNAAGGAFKSLATLSSRDVGTLYHELFHAYMDYIGTSAAQNDKSGAAWLLAFAKDRQECLYSQVTITPILQRKNRTETRFLTDRESWEALNESWAVFVGWTVWTQLELRTGRSKKHGRVGAVPQERWRSRLRKADRDGDLIGYYEPADSAERALVRKRYLAPSHRISPQEAAVLLEYALEYSREEARRSTEVMEQHRPAMPASPPCRY